MVYSVYTSDSYETDNSHLKTLSIKCFNNTLMKNIKENCMYF